MPIHYLRSACIYWVYVIITICAIVQLVLYCSFYILDIHRLYVSFLFIDKAT